MPDVGDVVDAVAAQTQTLVDATTDQTTQIVAAINDNTIVIGEVSEIVRSVQSSYQRLASIAALSGVR